MDREDLGPDPRDEELREWVDQLPPMEKFVIERRHFGEIPSHEVIAAEMSKDKQFKGRQFSKLQVMNLEKKALEKLRVRVEGRG